jgi:hypothetical protein
VNVILHVFSNSIAENLLTLAKEKEELLSILKEREANKEYCYIQMDGSNLSEIEDAIRAYERNLIAFQFSGHADERNLLVNDLLVNGSGIAMQLENCAKRFALKLVVLNGCSTLPLAEVLMKYSIPAVIGTTAPVEDESATVFSIHFWRNLVMYNMSIKNAYTRALGPAQARTEEDLTAKNSAWVLRGTDNAVSVNPIHFIPDNERPEPFEANSILFPGLIKAYTKWENQQVIAAQQQEKSWRMAAIINSVPHPISTHLQKLFSPFEKTPEGFDKVSLKRLQQIGQLYHNTAEFCWYIMVAQLWEIILELPDAGKKLELNVRLSLRKFFAMKTEERETLNFIALMHDLIKAIQELHADDICKEFIEKQTIYNDFAKLQDGFYEAAQFLMDLRISTYEDMVSDQKILFTCKKAEENLLKFLDALGFMHRYKLTSVQNINVIKLRHTKRHFTRYKHQLTFLMNPMGGEEASFYYMRSFIDTWSVILIKNEKRRRANIMENASFVTTFVDYLNLSPFVIDKNIYEKNTNLSDIMFFRGFLPNGTGYKRVSNTFDKKELQILPIEDNYSPLMKQFKNFKKTVLGNNHESAI